MRVGYLGPRGTFSEEALHALLGDSPDELVPLATVHEVVLAVERGGVDRALAPIENSLEGSVNATLDTLAHEAPGVRIVAETVLPVSQCLISRERVALEQITTVVSHPHATAQCARFLRERLPDAEVLAASSTAEAVQRAAAEGDGWAALSTRLAAELYDCEVLAEGVEDVPGNATRFVLLAPTAEAKPPHSGEGRTKTSIVFWGPGDDNPGWLVRCLSEFAFRGVNLTMIESRPRRLELGHYMFFVDLDGAEADAPVAEALEAVRGQVDELRVLGSYTAA